MKPTRSAQLPSPQGCASFDGCPPLLPHRSLGMTWHWAWYGGCVSRAARAVIEAVSALVADPQVWSSSIQPPENQPPPRKALMPSGCRYWSAGCVPSWVIP